MRDSVPERARSRRTALATIASNTGWTSGSRLADDAQDVAGRGLRVQRLGQLTVALLSSVNRRTFSMAITAWSAKVCSQLDLPGR